VAPWRWPGCWVPGVINDIDSARVSVSARLAAGRTDESRKILEMRSAFLYVCVLNELTSPIWLLFAGGSTDTSRPRRLRR
jgi:hypothetical protein